MMLYYFDIPIMPIIPILIFMKKRKNPNFMKKSHGALLIHLI